MPLPNDRLESDEPASSDDAFEAPGVSLEPARPGSAAVPMGTRPSPSDPTADEPPIPEESFADIYAELAHPARSAPVTPWRGIPALSADPMDAAPPRAAPLDEDEDPDAEPEPTLVGKVPDTLLELSNGRDENTRAFTAPRELIELARRRRDERRANAALSEAHSRATARPKEEREARMTADLDELKLPPAPKLPREAVADPAGGPERATSAAAPREEVPSPRPTAASRAAMTSEPEIEIDPSSELSPSAQRAVLASLRREAENAASEPSPGAPRKPRRSGLVLLGICLLVGAAVARWRDILTLFQ